MELAYEGRRRALGFFSLEKVEERDLTVVFHRVKGVTRKAELGLSRRCTAKAHSKSTGSFRHNLPQGNFCLGIRGREEWWVCRLSRFSLAERVKGSRGQAHMQVDCREMTSTFLAQIENGD